VTPPRLPHKSSRPGVGSAQPSEQTPSALRVVQSRSATPPAHWREPSPEPLPLPRRAEDGHSASGEIGAQHRAYAAGGGGFGSEVALEGHGSNGMVKMASASHANSLVAGGEVTSGFASVKRLGSPTRSSSHRQGGAMITPFDVLAILVICVVPAVLTVFVFSMPFHGITTFNAVAERKLHSWAGVIGLQAVLWGILLFVCDAQRWPRIIRIFAGFVTYALFWMASLLMSLTYPWAVVMGTTCLTPLLLFVFRSVRMSVRRTAFYWTAAAFMLVTAATLSAFSTEWAISGRSNGDMLGLGSGNRIWWTEAREQLIEETGPLYASAYGPRPLAYEDDCGLNKTVSARAEQTAIEYACSRVEAVQLVIWAAPLAVVVFHLSLAVFLMAQGRHHLNDARDVSGILRQFLAIMTFLMFILGGSLWYLAGVSPLLAQVYTTFCLLAIFGLLLFMWFEVREELLSELARGSMIVKYAAKFLHSDLFKAMAILVWFSLVPAFLVLDRLRQAIRVCKGTAENGSASFTPAGERVVQSMRTWSWNTIFSNVCLLGVLFVVLLLGGKATFVLFSWLNGVLADLSALIVTVLVFAIGIVMFMLPPVPGSAVYVFAGIVCGRRLLASLGNIWLATAISAAVALVSKLCGCCGQYAIGYTLGKSVRVQKLVGVDTVPTRAIEQILKTRGMGLGKVAILVGGPDWPTSVTCGILKLNIPQMILGTLPVFLVSVFPQTFVGALLVRENGDDDNPGFWAMLSTVCTSFAAFAQAAASLIAAYKITQTIERDHEKLAQPRKEHAQVAELTAKETQLVQALKRVSDWGGPHMMLRRKLTIIAAAAAMLLVGFIFAMDFVFSEPLCFRTFAITDSIDAPLQDRGLGGDPRNIVIRPVGAMNLYLFAGAALLFHVHASELGRAARRCVEVDME